MASNDNTVQLSLELATKAAEDALAKFQNSTKETTKTFDIFKGNLAATAAFDVLKGAFDAVGGVLHSMIDEASQAEKSIKAMEIALGQAGLAGQGNSKHFQDFADEIERTTIYSGDAAQAAIGLFASLNNLSRDGISQATKLATDLASTLGIDLPQASEMVAKAINGQMTAFNKLGIEVQKGKTDSENLANLTKALAGQQGAAAEAANTYAGAMAKLENQKGKLLEAFGKLVTQNSFVVDGIQTLTEAFENASVFIEDNKENITDLAIAFGASVVVVGTAAIALAAYTATAGSLTVALTALELAAGAAWAAVTGPVGIAVAAIVALGAAIYASIKYWDNIKLATYEATAAVLEYGAKVAGIFSKDSADALNAEAQALRDKAQATRELIAEKQKDKESKVEPEEQAQSANARKELEDLKRLNQEKLNQINAFRAQRFLAEQDTNLLLQDLEAQHLNTMKEIKDGATLTDLQAELDSETVRLQARQDFERQALQATQDAALAKIKLMENQTEREKALQDFQLQSQLENTKLANKQQIELTKQRYKTEEQLNSRKLSDQKSTYATIATLANSSNKTLATIGKAAGLTQIAIDTPVAISKAMAAFPPPFNFVAAAAVGAAMASQAAQLAGVQFEHGGIVPGTSYTGDRITAGVNSREMVLNMEQQRQLFKVANGESSSSGSNNESTNALLGAILEAVSSNQSININGKEIINVVKDGLGSGRSLAY